MKGLAERLGRTGSRARRLFCTAGLVCACLAGWPARADAQFGALISPGQLSKAHASLEGIANCQKCHEQGRKVTAQKCLACHAPVADRMARRIGVHRDVKGDCVSCHAEHAGVDGELRPFDETRFDHAAVTGFALTGKHALGAERCAACHKTRSFLTLTPACASCHADVHKGRLGPNCASCHSTQVAFTHVGGQFDHAAAAFPLTGAHKTVACTACHVNQVFRGLKFATCTDCHRDPHRQAFGATCTSCHTTDTWRTKKIDHSRTAFPLLGRHRAVDCAACHKQDAMKVKPRSDTCAACHVDVHKGTFKQACSACHSESGWNRAPFDHTTTKFPLTGKHSGLACASCHKNVVLASRTRSKPVADFRGLKTTCVSCHADVHHAELGAACESCHTTASFRVTAFTHPRTPEFFAGQHAALACDRCHVPDGTPRPAKAGVPLLPGSFKSVSTACASCHKDVHLGQEGSACETCHTVQTAGFALPNFSHTTTAFALTGRHQTLTCAQCHKRETGTFPAGAGTAVRFKGLSRECRACHQDVHLGQLGSRCEGCHTTTTFKLPGYRHRNARSLREFFAGSHARAACAACHKPVTGAFPQGHGTAVKFQIETRCVTCHVDKHRGALGSNCIECHRP